MTTPGYDGPEGTEWGEEYHPGKAKPREDGRAEVWCALDCPRQQTHMWKDCTCGGARREFDALREERIEGGEL